MQPISHIILDEQPEQYYQELETNPLLLQANIIYQQKIIFNLTRQNEALKHKIQQLNHKLSQQVQISQASLVKSEILKISNYIKEAEQGRQSILNKSEQEKETLRKQLQTYKQKYNQSVSANLRKTKTLDKNQAMASKLQQENKIMKTENTKHLQTIQQLKLQVSKMEIERKRLNDQNQMRQKQLESVRFQLIKQKQQHDREITQLQKSIYQHQRTIEDNIEKQREITQLERKYDVLKKQNKDLCVICYEKEAVLVNENCGHLICCFDCSGDLIDCPMCRSQKTRFIRLWRT